MVMKFILNIKNKKINDEEILKDLKDIFKQLNITSLSMKDYDENGKYSSSLVSRRFGSWNKALKQADIPCRQEYWTVDELMLNISSVWVSKGRQPTRRDMNNKTLSKISSGAYLRKYGSWYNALKAFVSYMKDSKDGTSYNNKGQNSPGHKTKRDINLRLRFKVLQRDNFKCCICGASPAKDPSVVLHIDHKKPWSKGGETVLDNLQTLCEKCNLGKSNISE